MKDLLVPFTICLRVILKVPGECLEGFVDSLCGLSLRICLRMPFEGSVIRSLLEGFCNLLIPSWGSPRVVLVVQRSLLGFPLQVPLSPLRGPLNRGPVKDLDSGLL